MPRDDDRRFLHIREQRNRFARIAVPVLLAVWIAFWVWLIVQVPLLANPYEVIGRLQRNEIAPGTTVTMAGLLPVAICLLGLIVTAFLLFAWSWARTEIRLLQMAQRGPARDTEGAHRDGWSL